MPRPRPPRLAVLAALVTGLVLARRGRGRRRDDGTWERATHPPDLR